MFLTSTDAATGGGSMIIMMVVMIAVFYFFLIRPENKKKKEANEMRNALKVGDNITTIGGIIGDIVSIKDESSIAKWAVSTTNNAEKAAAKAKEAAVAARKAEKKGKK